MLAPIQQDRITDVVYATIRQNILQRRFAAGERIHVDELARQLAVSRTPVREALNLLAAEGLVDIVPRSGTFITSLSPQDVKEVFDLRIALEGLAAERVGERGLSEEQIRELREVLAHVHEGVTLEERTLKHAETNRAFHEGIVKLSGNRKLAQIYSSLNAHTMMAFIHYASPSWSDRWDTEMHEHQRVFDALVARQPARAREAMEAHLRRGRDSLIADMEAAGEAGGNGR